MYSKNLNKIRNYSHYFEVPTITIDYVHYRDISYYLILPRLLVPQFVIKTKITHSQ